MQHPIITGIDTIETNAQTTHIHLSLREMLDTCGVVHVAQDMMRESRLQLLARLIEESKLTGRELVEVIAVGTHEMTEHRAWDDGCLVLQTVYKFEEILFGIEAQTMHTRIELDMYGPTRDSFLTSGLDKGIHQSEGVHLWLEVVVEHCLEGRHLWIHDHDIGGDASLTEGNTFIGHGDSQIVDTVVLQRLGNLHGTCTIGIGLDHTHHFRIRLQERTVIVQVLHNGVEVHLENRLVHLLLQLFRNLVEAKRTGALQ